MKKLLLILMHVWLSNLDGQTSLWSQLGTNPPYNYNISTMFVDTIDNLLYIGGKFEYIGGKKCRGAAKWNGSNWDSLAGGFDKFNSGNFINDVKKILRYKNKIYFFGTFFAAGNYTNAGMAVWNGTDWESTIFLTNGGQVYDADVYNDTLYIGGSFNKVGNINSLYAAKFDGINWYSLSFPFQIGPITSIKVFKNKVYALGTWYSNGFGLTAEWSSTNGWQPSFGIQGDINKTAIGLERIDSLLFIYGRFTHVSTMYSPCVVSWSGTHFYGYGLGTGKNNYSTIKRIKKIDNKMFVAGSFDNAGGMYLPGVSLGLAELYNNKWCIYGEAFDNDVLDIVKYNNDRIICGPFRTINGDSVKMIAKWVGANYTYSCSIFDISVSSTPEQNIQLHNIKVYPNPIGDFIQISYQSIENKDLIISIYNAIGQNVFHKSIYSSNELIDVQTLQTGMYFIVIQEGDKTLLYKKVIKD